MQDIVLRFTGVFLEDIAAGSLNNGGCCQMHIDKIHRTPKPLAEGSNPSTLAIHSFPLNQKHLILRSKVLAYLR